MIPEEKPDLRIEELLFRNISTILPSKDFLISEYSKAKSENRRLRIYHGIDPTSPELHIGHYASLKKMKHFQEAGFEIIILVGGMTGIIGDPSDKKSVRKQLTVEQVKENIESIKKQISKVIKFDGENPAKIVNNYDWLSKLNLESLIPLLSLVTHEQMIERDMFQERLKNNEPIYMHEFMYPMMQGYDSVALDTDIELGGSDQLFNMMMGRDLLKKLKNKEKFVITTNLLTDQHGKKIGKSEGNGIPFANGKPYETYAGIMSLSDEVIIKCFVALTDINLEEISTYENDIKNYHANPMKYKKMLAHRIVLEVYSEEDAENCEKEFENTVQKGQFALTDVKEVTTSENTKVLDFLRNKISNLSGSEIKKVIEQNGLEINDQKITDFNYILKNGDLLKFGKKIFMKVVIK